MTQAPEPASSDLSRLDPASANALAPDDRRHLTRFLARHCAAGALLDACVQGHGPLPKLMDRFISQVVDTHRHLSGGTFVDAGDRLEVHPQSLRVLSRKVETRPPDPGCPLADTPDTHAQEKWLAVACALGSGQGHLTLESLSAELPTWTGPVDVPALSRAMAQWVERGILRQEGGIYYITQPDVGLKVESHARTSIIADQVVDFAAIHLATPMILARQPRLARMTYSRGVLRRAAFATTSEEVVQHLRETVEIVQRKWGTDDPNGETVCVTLLMGQSSTAVGEYETPEWDVWLRALARHLCREGGLREAMPIVYQEVARELRRRSQKRAYDLDLLKAVGRARQNVHEWEAGRGFHFRGPAPETVVDESSDALSAGHLRQYARVFLQERSHRACKIGEFLAWLQKEVGVKIEEQVLVQILDDEVAMGAARLVPGGSEPAYQAVRSFRRTWAQNVAQRRANLELVIRATAGLVAGSAAQRPNFRDAMAMVTVRPGCAASFAADILERSADFHAQMLGRHENLDPDHQEVLDVEVTMVLSPTAPPLVPTSRKL